MRKFLGVSACCALLALAGCGGVAELEQDEVEVVQTGTDTVATAARKGSFNAGDEKKVEALLVLCHEKPLAEYQGDSVREIVKDLAPRLKGADPAFSKRVENVAAHGCD